MTSPEDEFVHKAEALARGFYAGKTRSGKGNRPYIDHPLSLLSLLRQHRVTDPVVLAAALLHDAVEENGHDPQVALTIGCELGSEVLEVVLEVTDLGNVSREHRRAEQIARAATYSQRAAMVRIADKLANLTEILDHPPRWAPKHILSYAQFAMGVVHVCGQAHLEMATACKLAHTAIENRYAALDQTPRS